MKTRSGGDYSLRSLCVGALSAASIGLFGLALTQQSPAKLATADSPLSSSARTALGMRKSAEAPKPGSSDQGIMKLAAIPRDLFDSPESKALKEADANIKLARGRYLVQQLGLGEVSRGEPPVEIGDEEKRRLGEELNKLVLSPKERDIVYKRKEFRDLSNVNFYDADNIPLEESEAAKFYDNDEPGYLKFLQQIYAETAYITKKQLRGLPESTFIPVERPLTMLAMYRLQPFGRFMILTLPYRINKIAERFVVSHKSYSFDAVSFLPELQKETRAPISFTYVSAYEDNLAYSEVKHDEETVVSEEIKLATELSQVSSAKDLSRLIEGLKEDAKIPPTHELVIAHVKLSDPITKAEKAVLCSNVGVVESLQKRIEQLNGPDNSAWTAQLADVDAIFVDRKSSHLMKNHIVEAFKMLDDYRIWDDELNARSAQLLDEMKEGFQAIADKE